MRWFIIGILFAGTAFGQISHEEAHARLLKRQAEREAAATQPATQPTTAPVLSELEELYAQIDRLMDRINELKRENAELRERLGINDAALSQDFNPPEQYDSDDFGGPSDPSARLSSPFDDPSDRVVPGTAGGGGGGTVHVRSYRRKDGTYVRSHTRRSPRR